MFARILAVAFVFMVPGISNAQLPAQHFYSINHLGRYLGFGYSDGYHACKDGRCSEAKSRNWDFVSTFSGPPTLPPNTRLFGRQPIATSPIYNQGYCAEPIVTPSMQSQMVNSIQDMMPIEVAPAMTPTPAQPSFLPQLQSQPQTQSARPSTPPWSPSDRGTFEAVPPAPRQSPSSPVVREESDLPSPLQRKDSNSPEAQYRRVPPGAYSLIQPTSVRSR
jgi:hypothetical protein